MQNRSKLYFKFYIISRDAIKDFLDLKIIKLCPIFNVC